MKLLKTGIPLIIHGEDGAGKSQLASRAARELNWDTRKIIASNEILMQRDLWKNLRVSMGREKGIKILESCEIPILNRNDVAIIFDNVVDLSLLEQIVGLKCVAQIIITTELEPSTRMKGFNSIELKRWSVGVVREFLGNDCGLWRIKEQNENLFLPQALELAAVYIWELGVNWEHIWANLENLEVEYYAAELYMQLEKRKQFEGNVACEVIELLQYCSLLCGESVRMDILGQLGELDLKRTEERLYDLERMHLVRLKEGDVYICPKIQMAVVDKMEEEERRLRIKRILCNAETVLERIDIEPWKLCEGKDWRAHIEHILAHGLEESDGSDEFLGIKMRFYLLAGKYDLYSGEYISAGKFFRQIKDCAKQDIFDEVRRKAMIGLARVLEAEKDNEGVRNEIAEIGVEWPYLAQEAPALMADILLIASQAEENLGSYRKAESILREGLKLLEDSSLPVEISEEKKVYLLNGLGKIYCIRHRYLKAMDCFNKALHCCETTSGFKEAFVKHNKGYVWYWLGKYKYAEECFLSASEIYQSVCLGEPTRDELDNLNALINLYTKMKGKEEELDRIWKLEQQRMMEGGQEYRDAELYLYNNYSIYLYKRGSFEEALDILNKGIMICEQARNANYNIIWIFLLTNRAETLVKLGQPIAALESLDLAIKKSRTCGGLFLWIYRQRFLIWLKNVLF